MDPSGLYKVGGLTSQLKSMKGDTDTVIMDRGVYTTEKEIFQEAKLTPKSLSTLMTEGVKTTDFSKNVILVSPKGWNTVPRSASFAKPAVFCQKPK